MDFGGIFRNLFQLETKKTINKSEEQSTTGVTTKTPCDPDLNIYDDTDLGSSSYTNSRSNEKERRCGGNVLSRLPTFQDIDKNNECDDEMLERHDHDSKNRTFIPGPGSNFVFGELFSMVREMFGEMERSMKEMDEFFNNTEENNFPNFNFDVTELDEPPKSDNENDSTNNIRHHVLKRENVPRPPIEQRIDEDLDDVYKNSKLDLSEIPGLQRKNRDGLLEDAWKPKDKDPNSTNRFQYSHTIRQYKSSPDGTIIQGKTIRETNEGREIITYKKNDKGEVEENKEFIPRGGSGNDNDGLSDDFKITPHTRDPRWNRMPFHDFFFPRPRI